MKNDIIAITNHPQDAGSLSRKAHEAWLESIQAQNDDKRIEALQRGDEAWVDALHQLRLAGIDELPASDEERESLLCFAQEDDDQPIDFRPLQRSIVIDTAFKIFDRLMLASFAFASGYLLALAA